MPAKRIPGVVEGADEVHGLPGRVFVQNEVPPVMLSDNSEPSDIVVAECIFTRPSVTRVMFSCHGFPHALFDSHKELRFTGVCLSFHKSVTIRDFHPHYDSGLEPQKCLLCFQCFMQSPLE